MAVPRWVALGVLGVVLVLLGLTLLAEFSVADGLLAVGAATLLLAAIDWSRTRN